MGVLLPCHAQVVLHTTRAKEATGEILAMHRIPHDRSQDLMASSEHPAGPLPAADATATSSPPEAVIPESLAKKPRNGRAKK